MYFPPAELLTLAVELIRQAELFGVAPTSQKLSIMSMTVEPVSEGKIIEHWRVTDELDMMRQLGERSRGLSVSSSSSGF